jgi:hypothetical protein
LHASIEITIAADRCYRSSVVLEFRKRELASEGRLYSILGRGCSRHALKMLFI